MFNDPSGSEAKQYQMMRYLIDMIDCTPALNPDGSQASIKFSFYSLTYAPVQAALSAAAQRGVVRAGTDEQPLGQVRRMAGAGQGPGR